MGSSSFVPRKKSLHSQGHPSFAEKGVSALTQCRRNYENASAICRMPYKDYCISKVGKKFWLEEGQKEEEKKPRLHCCRIWVIACVSTGRAWLALVPWHGEYLWPHGSIMLKELLVPKLNVEGILSFLPHSIVVNKLILLALRCM